GLTPSSRWEVQVAGKGHSDVPVYRSSEDVFSSDQFALGKHLHEFMPKQR
ncbi:hypothetical protein A2U01_0060175, partial [Trifolium medium]|nr:hypothetical protein [Trifolium medium]